MSDKPFRPDERTDPALWVDRHGDGLFRYALVRVGRADLAEDLVQETFLAALQAHPEFAGRSSERTWLISILRHKLVDHFRLRERQRLDRDAEALGQSIDDLFDARGRWRNKPAPGGEDPAAALEEKEFQEIFQRCLGRLPETLAAAFVLREMEGMATEAIREALDVSSVNVWKMLSRARLGLSRCLDVHWFQPGSSRE